MEDSRGLGEAMSAAAARDAGEQAKAEVKSLEERVAALEALVARRGLCD